MKNKNYKYPEHSKKEYEHQHNHSSHDSCNCKPDGHHDHIQRDSCNCGHEHQHNHTQQDSCNCGLDHQHNHTQDDSCNCEHEYQHNHSQQDSCNCGLDHQHNHTQQDSCNCAHQHIDSDISKQANQESNMNLTKSENRIYILEHLGCANCAAKMEKKINELPEVEYATITYATKQLRIASNKQDTLLPKLQAICSSIESEVKVIPKENNSKQKISDLDHSHSEKRSKISILLGAGLFLLGEILEKQIADISVFSTPVFILAYLILGGEILLTAIKNITKGRIFDENFLMSIATLGAFVIKEYPEAVGVMLFYRIGEYFEHRAVEKSRNQIMNTIDMRPEVVTVSINDKTKVIPAQDAVVGDIVIVRPGDRIPLDGVIVEGESRIDTSPITGEPVPVYAGVNSSVISGCVNTSGLLKIRVEKPLEESMVTRILDSVENAAANKPKIDRFITRFARIYTPFVVILATATAIIPSLITGDWNHWIYTALTFLVISCPCALVLSVPLAFFSGIGAGSKKGILFKGGISLEAIKNVKAVVMDKTGTITKGNFVVQTITPVNGMDETTLLTLCASCELNSTHPIGNSIVTAAKEKNLSLIEPSSIEEIAGKGIKAMINNNIILCGNKKLMDSFEINLSSYYNQTSGTEVFVSSNGLLIGYISISDTIKEDATYAIESIHTQNIITAMLTGDTQENADEVARKTGVKEVHAKLLPQDKITELMKIRETHGAVMFVGDGINDAPVLAGADVGAAMGTGADAAIEAADVVFMTSDMSAIPESIAIAKITSQIAWQNVIFALFIKALVMVLGLTGYASMWMAVFADSGVAMLCVLNSIRILYKKKLK